MPDDYLVGLQLDDGGVHEYLFIGGPIESPDENTEIFAKVGLAAATWARMEQHIDAILVQINKAHYSDETLDLYDEDHPRPFTDKIDLLKRYFNKHPGLSKYTDTVRDFAGGLLKLSIERNEAMHGVLEEFDRIKQTYTLNGMTYRRKTKDFRNRHQVSPIARINDFIRLTNLAHYGLCEISKELFTTDAAERLQMPKRLIPGS